MELYVKCVFLALLGLSSAFLMPDILANETSPSAVTSNSQGTDSTEQRLQDLMTLLMEEKRLRYSLEQRLDDTEHKLHIFDKFHNAVSNELQAERDKVSQHEITLANATNTINTLVNTIGTLESRLHNASIEINQLMVNNSILEQQVINVTKDINGRLNNVTSEIDGLVKNAQSNHTIVNGFAKKLNMTIIEMDNLKNDVQHQYQNITQHFLELNKTSLRNDNMVAFSVDYPDNSHHDPQQFYNQRFNIGGAYNPSTGIFTCKQPGVYVFMWTATQYSSGSNQLCCLGINGSPYRYACAVTGGGAGEHQSGSRSAIVYLETTDQVYLSCDSGLHYPHSGFSGFLLYPDN